MKKKNLVEIIKNNPRCVAHIDNDYWVLHSENGKELANSDNNFVSQCDEDDSYDGGNCYGGDILVALAKICNVKLKSV